MKLTNSLVPLTFLLASLAQANLIAYWPFDDLSGEVAEDIITFLQVTKVVECQTPLV